MKLITLNIWGGILHEPLLSFIKEQSKTVDIFCFQEDFNNPPGIFSKVTTKKPRMQIHSEIEAILPEFNSYIHPVQDGEESQSIFVRKTISINKVDEVFVYRWKNAMEGIDSSTYGVNLEYFQFIINNKHFTVCNLHGHWTPRFKGDSPARLEQSHNIKKFFDGVEGAKILCGDFNVSPNTQSMNILEENMRNLVKEYNVTSTRSSYYDKGVDKFADYILISPEVIVKDFKVLPEEVSDHLSLYFEFE